MIETAPYLGTGIVAAILGYQFAEVVPEVARVYLQISFLGLMFSMIILDKEPGWNLVLLICFGIGAGMTIAWSDSKLLRENSWIVIFILVAISFVGGALMKNAEKRRGVIFSVFILIYMMGWVLLSLFSLPDLVGTIWIFSGLALFTFILMAVISQGKTLKDQNRAIPISIQLFVALFNLCWLSNLL